MKATPKGSIGFAFDGDGDRLLCIDEEGKVISGAQILGVLGLHFLRKPDTIVFTQMLNPGIKYVLSENGFDVLETKVGDKYVMNAMVENNLSIGGEDSGHMIFKSFWPLGDGIISALLIIRVLTEKNKSLAELSQNLQPFPERLINIKNIKPSITVTDQFIIAFDKISAEIKSEGKILIRPSGTEPVTRLYASHPDQKLLDLFMENAISLFESFGGSV